MNKKALIVQEWVNWSSSSYGNYRKEILTRSIHNAPVCKGIAVDKG